ncbi:PREDICTED: cyclic nucleotide-binding domain-containing protein 1 [Ceratotherium simum simum]|uniref:Cyclic nucleotide-binding domain-containing protein 1 n=1 Tax=Ceratotherium simum simum TaxID=73337 RepID=A0ABM1DHP0_CERSS|nr:PREDICTED: cyclic nucleotide-binding domain-containing protein 1 [Ceratotherium simum simum]
MPVSSLPSAVLSHMIAINNVPPPPLRNIPSLKMSKRIDYGQLNTLCHVRGLQYNSCSSMLSAHNIFMKQYPKIFLQKKSRLPKLSKQEGKRKPTESPEESQPQQPDDDSHNVALYVKKAHGGHTLHGPKNSEENLVEFLAILKKLPVYRTQSEHNTMWKMLKTIPDLTSQLTDEHLRTLSKSVISETWVKGSTVIANDGFYIILKGLARPRTQVYKNLIEESESTPSFVSQTFHSFVFDEDFKHSLLGEMRIPSCDPMLRQWSTFGTLEVTAHMESATKYSVVIEEDCEILKISAKNYAKLKSEQTKLENKQKEELIRKCPYYKEWPTLSIYELVALIKWKKFPPGHVIVESGNVISFVAYINSGYCNIYRSIIGFVKLQSKKVKKIRKLVYMGQLKEEESFGEISVLLQDPFTCTVVTGKEVELAIIEDKDLFELDPVTKQLMLQTAQPTFGHLTDLAEVALISWLVAPSCIFKANSGGPSPHVSSLGTTFLPSSSSFKDSCDQIGPSWAIQATPPISQLADWKRKLHL